jgi:hypothetical protein
LRWSATVLAEWLAKRQSQVPGHEPAFLHLIYDEWFPSGHLRVSVRGDGAYALELDGMSGWNHWAGRSSDGQRLRGAHGFFSAPTGGFVFLDEFVPAMNPMTLYEHPDEAAWPSFPPCPVDGDRGDGDFHASMTLVAEFATPYVFRSWWTSPDCPGFPKAIAKRAWDLLARVAGKAVARPSYAE